MPAPLLETIAAAVGLYMLLPKALRDAAERTADVWIDEVLKSVGVDAIERLRGTGERRAIRQVLSKAVALTLARQEDLDAVAVASDFRKPPFSEEVTRILARPEDEIDADRVRSAFRDSRYELSDLGLDEVELLQQIRVTFRALLKRDERTRSVWSAMVLDRVSRDVEAIRPSVERTEVGVADLVAARAAARAAGPFLTGADFFAPWMNRRHLFHHSWVLVGRSVVLEDLERFVASDEQLAAVLPGRGGVGKSRVFRAFAESLESGSLVVRFIAEGRPVSGPDFSELPDGPALLIIDDAHRRDDLDAILALARRRLATKVLLSVRGYGADAVRAALVRTGFDIRESTVFDELQELDRESTIELARQALGPDWEHLAESLAGVTGDSPLVTAIGGRLIAEQALPPGLLAQHAEFREAVLARLAHEYFGALDDQVKPNLARRILELVAAAGPVRPKNVQFVQVAAGFIDIEPDEFVRALDAMERGGILLRRGGTLRITPDVLADFLLDQASLTSTGARTGFVERVFDTFFPVTPGPVLANLAEMDWQARHGPADTVDLLDEVWRRLEEEFQSGSNYRRKEMLDLLRDVALLQPGRTLQLIEYAIHNPSTVEDPSPFEAYASWNHSDVVDATPELLRRIAYHADYRSRALDLLWELGRDDARSPRQGLGHPIRILGELASYEMKRLDMATAVLDRAERWMERETAHGHAQSVLDVIDPMLEKAGSRMTADGFAISVRPYLVNPDSTRAVRDRALALVARCTHSDSLVIALRGVKSLSNALRNAIGEFGVSAPDDLQARWIPEQLIVLDMLEELIDGTRDPLVAIVVMEAVAWHACYGQDPLKERARSIIAGIDQGFEFMLTKHLTGSYRFDILECEEIDSEGDERDQRFANKWERRTALEAAEVDGLVTEFVSRFPSADDGLAHLEARFGVILEAKSQLSPGELLFHLSKTAPVYAETICRAAVTKSIYLKRYVASLISGMRSQSERAADRLIDDFMRKGDDELTRIVAASCCQVLWMMPPPKRPLEILTDLLQHPDKLTREHAVRGLGILSRNDRQLALELGLNADLGSDGRLADALFQAFGQHRGRFEHVDKAAVEALLARLVPVDDIGEWATARFLDHASRLAPVEVIHLILSRAKYARTSTDTNYEVMPHDLEASFSGFASATDRLDLLREIRDLSMDADEALDFWIPRLFAAVSRNYAEDGRSVLNEWIDSGDAGRIAAVADLVRPAGSDFVLAEPEFITNMVERAHSAGPECFAAVWDTLFMCAATRGGSGLACQPMPHDVGARDRAAEIARTLPAGSAARAFYQRIETDAADAIRRTMERNAEIE